ncbi:VanZ family protein [Ideonella sp. 4Y11]|uniref:VanZ family protein n=1 Tax=Ideonella aquatica TaxID=2824119 RepID=A0A941BJ65_9BURK|nr:VanZ family protein [Ideonella aquatica]MBQ0959247.1 VanZ family protein [Ideonella aquatica]
MARHSGGNSAAALALAFAGLIVYASLYPFSGWQWPQGAGLVDLLALPWPRWHPVFDIWANLLGYAPLGALLVVAQRPRGRSPLAAVWRAALVCAALSYAMETAQHLIPGRYPSLLDLGLNSAGGLVGALLAVLVMATGWPGHWQSWRQRWFIGGDAPLGLLLAWPLGLLFPAPFPMGLGLGWERIQDGLVGLLIDVDWAQEALEWISDVPAPIERPVAVVSGLGMVLGLLAPCLIACAVTGPGWRRLVLCTGAVALGLATTTLSAALNFGPAHALGWLGPEVFPAMVAVGVLLLLLAPLGARLAAGLGVVVLVGLVVLVAQVPADPYFADSLQAWEQGRFIRFHGLAQWIGWFWPYLALGWLLHRLAAQD